MDLKEIFDYVSIIIIDKLAVEDDKIVPKAMFTDDLGADSLDTVELSMDVEEKFGIKIEDKELEELTDVQSLVELISKKLAKKEK